MKKRGPEPFRTSPEEFEGIVQRMYPSDGSSISSRKVRPLSEDFPKLQPDCDRPEFDQVVIQPSIGQQIVDAMKDIHDGMVRALTLKASLELEHGLTDLPYAGELFNLAWKYGNHDEAKVREAYQELVSLADFVAQATI